MDKKADLSIQLIIVAIIALIVLAVVVLIFFDQIKNVAKGFTKTREDSQICRTDFLGGQKCDKSCGDGWESAQGRCEDPGEICCQRKKAAS